MAEISGGKRNVQVLLAGAVIMASVGGFALLAGKPAAEIAEVQPPISVGRPPTEASQMSAEVRSPLLSADIPNTDIRRNDVPERQTVPPVAWQVQPFTEFYAKGGAVPEKPVPPARPSAPAVEIAEFERARQTEQAAAKAAVAAEAEQRKPRPLEDFFKK